MKTAGLLFLVGSFALVLPATAGKVSATVTSRPLTFKGTTSFKTQVPASNQAPTGSSLETRIGPSQDESFEKVGAGSTKPARVPSSHVPAPSASPVMTDSSSLGFAGLTHADQRLAGSGLYENTNFSSEPPDQCLAVGSGYVLEGVNSAFRIRKTDGTLLTAAIPMNQFFNLAPSLVRTTPAVYGPFTSDPRCYYDSGTARWFVTVLAIDTDPATGAYLPNSHVYIAVSQTADPTTAWYIYDLNTTNYTGTPDHAGCPCFGDQPLLGADQNGFYVTTNEFPIFTGGFNGAQIYALSKSGLESGASLTGVAFSGIPLAEGLAYSVQPATTPPGGTFAAGNGGTEYFMSALDFNATLDNRIAVWALTNTSSLNSAPNVSLYSTVLDSQVYGQPADSVQPKGPLPLADFIFEGGFGVKTGKQHEELIAANDDRMQQVVFAGGKLWSALSSVVKPPNGTVRVGAAYFIVSPSWTGGSLGGSIVNQGYVSVNRNSVLYPAIGVNSTGQGVMGFTLVGDDYYPSAAYVRLNAATGAGAVNLVAPGAAPDDGFTGYPVFGGRSGRWGDYSAASADESGNVWFATEFIPNAPRTTYANWGSFIASIVP